MLNRIFAILILCGLIGSNFTRFFIVAGFELNQGYIAEKLCENKSRPWMNCHGKCFLMKKLKQAEEKEKKQERENRLSQHMEALPAMASTFIFKKLIAKAVYSTFHPLGPITRAFDIFQPPKAIG